MAALYGFAFSENALEFLENVVPVKIRGQIKRRIEALAENPTPPGSKKLHGVMDGENPVYRARQGDYLPNPILCSRCHYRYLGH
jgi:mRNA-degrading endonuclease RelE of RelBE toxin-antitoxin system